MRTETVGRRRATERKRDRIWVFFGMTLVALIYSAVAGTQSVRASSSCTTAQCNSGHTYAIYQCVGHRGLFAFECPVPDEPDDFFFLCADQVYAELDDCDTHAPS